MLLYIMSLRYHMSRANREIINYYLILAIHCRVSFQPRDHEKLAHPWTKFKVEHCSAMQNLIQIVTRKREREIKKMAFNFAA